MSERQTEWTRKQFLSKTASFGLFTALATVATKLPFDACRSNAYADSTSSGQPASANEFASLDATAQAELVRKKEVKPIELVEAAIRRIEELNPKLNAIITPLYEQARAAAEGKLPDGPFTGVPFLLKDLGPAYAGARQTSGSAFLKEFVPAHDSELVKRQKRAGLVVVGKTNTPEFGLLPTTEPRLFGPTHNPWDLNRTPGGSSGGSAAAVAACLTPMAHGNDGGGSIRIPASCCGVFGLKPTRGRVSLAPDIGDEMNGFTADHAVTRSVRDSAALLDATAGPAPGDPYWPAPPERPFAKEAGANPGKLRIAFTTTLAPPLHPDCVSAVRDAAALCADLGHRVSDASPEYNAELLVQLFIPVWAAGAAWAVDGLAAEIGKKPVPEQFEPLTWALYEMGKKLSASDYLLAITGLQGIARDIARFFADYDVWLTPTLAEPPPPLGSFRVSEENPIEGIRRAAAFVPFTPICNVTGQPAMSVPLYWNDAKLPIGAHFAGRYGDEATLFRLAAQLEEARPWTKRKPPVSA